MRHLAWMFIVISPLLAFAQSYDWSMAKAAHAAAELATQASTHVAGAVLQIVGSIDTREPA